jgi:hypothetical protein
MGGIAHLVCAGVRFDGRIYACQHFANEVLPSAAA